MAGDASIDPLPLRRQQMQHPAHAVHGDAISCRRLLMFDRESIMLHA